MVSFYRKIDVAVDNLDEKFMKATATMENNATNAPKLNIFKIEVIIERENFEITEVRNVLVDSTVQMCSATEGKGYLAKGLRIGPGYNKQVIERVGGPDGCAHLVELLIEIGRCAYQGNLFYDLENIGMDATIKELQRRKVANCYRFSRYGK